jgi:hypothetical protein
MENYKSPHCGQILVELIQSGAKTLQSKFRTRLKKELPDQWKRSVMVPIYKFTRRAIKLTVVIIVGYQCYQLHVGFYVTEPPE